jgi:hypothetical protein
LGPPNGERFGGWEAQVILRWSRVPGKGPDEYYVVRIPYDDAGSVAEFWRQETTFQVPSNFSLRSTGFADRHYHWTVQVVRCAKNCDRVQNDDVKKEGREAGERSAEGLFYWEPDIVPPPTPTPRP